ncbi:response regulator transcription factor [Gammaproteobacteria bacterium]|nr:response regulator transcription factor [Gammaproteobacteria bacterium]
MQILIADDHSLFVDGMCHILKKLADTVAVTTSANAEQTIEILESQPDFDLVLIDLNMPGMNGLSILQRMKESGAMLPIVVISAEENANTIQAALHAGALGFIPKSHSSDQMLDALRAILTGDIYVPADIQKQLDNNGTHRPPLEAINNKALQQAGISQRQYEVLKLLAEGYSNKKIALSLFLAEHTVKVHVSALFKSLQAGNRTECVKAAIARGILDE